MKKIRVGKTLWALVDDEDYDSMNQFIWSLVEWKGKQYAKRKQRLSDESYPHYATISMHNQITGFTYVDHIDGDGLNNQRSNLREVNHQQNIQNQKVQKRSHSGYRGVTLFQPEIRKKPWRARIKIEGRDRTIGYFATARDAAIVWNSVALKAWGEYAFQNQITEDRR